VSTINPVATKYNFTKHHAAIADLVVVAFFYLLCVGEYTLPSNPFPNKRSLSESAMSDCVFGGQSSITMLTPVPSSGRIVLPSPLPTPKMAAKRHLSIILQLVVQFAQLQPWLDNWATSKTKPFSLPSAL
jgi:hypothetical protein